MITELQPPPATDMGLFLYQNYSQPPGPRLATEKIFNNTQQWKYFASLLYPQDTSREWIQRVWRGLSRVEIYYEISLVLVLEWWQESFSLILQYQNTVKILASVHILRVSKAKLQQSCCISIKTILGSSEYWRNVPVSSGHALTWYGSPWLVQYGSSIRCQYLQ